MRRNSMFQRPMRLLGAASLLFAALLMGQAQAAPVLGKIVGSKHDLTSTGSGTNKTSSTTEICVFCHTPHGATASSPLWNRALSASTAFSRYTSTTMDGANDTLAGTSLACLSCHDGQIGLDQMVNRPGSGTSSTAYVWTSGGGVMPTVANLGVDLGNDHPIGVPYCGGLKGTAACKDGDFNVDRLMLAGAVQSGPVATPGKWWVDTGTINSTQEKTDLVLYYTTTAAAPTVQCASCHEPHGASVTTGAVSFLRVSNDSSALCLTCHNK